MKLRKVSLLTAVALTSSLSVAEIEIDVSGQMIFEASKFLEHDDGMVQDNQTFQAHGKDWFKDSVDLRVYIDGDIDDIIENATFHVELNGFVNPLGSGADNGNNYNEAYTQRDILREAYIDTEYDDWTIRAGKQQVVWGTADGMKLLDMMNPTDYTEMAQNQMEDSRIPVWMFSAETVLANDTDLTMVISEPRENIFAGLNRSIVTSVRGNGAHVTNWAGTGVPIGYEDTPGVSHDAGQFTLMRGPTSITGAYDGFTNIIPDMGSIAALFGESFSDFELGTDNDTNTSYKLGGLYSEDFKGFKVEEFLSGDSDAIHSNFGAFSDRMQYVINSDDPTNNGFGDMNFAKYVDNMYGAGSWDAAQVAADAVRTTTLAANANATEDDIQDAIQLAVDAGDIGAQYTIEGDKALSSFFTSKFASNLFDTRDGGADFSQGTNTDSAFEYMGNTTFKTFDAFVNAKNQYSFKNMPSSDQVDFAIRNAGKAKNGMNWQVAYAYGFDRNPIIEMNWKNMNGDYLTVGYEDSNGDKYTSDTCPVEDCTLTMYDSEGEVYGGDAQDAAVSALGANATDAQIQAAIDSKSAILEFAQETTRIHSLGGAFDMAIETGDTLGTMVLRGEGIYQKGVHQPTVHFDKLSYGDLASSLEMREIDRFKFVIGFDFTFLTNMFSSLQIIRDINLDSMYCAPGTVKVTCDADFATMMLSNGFNTDGAVEFKEYYSLYFSKPFGVSGQHRWNNMTMYEGGDGWWNWFTVGFGMTDDIEATFELNHYWGNPNTAFGQHQKSNNVQVGIKYNF